MAAANGVSTDASAFLIIPAPAGFVPTPAPPGRARAGFVPTPAPAGGLSNGTPPTPQQESPVYEDWGENVNIEDQVDVAKCVDQHADEYTMDHKYRGRAVILNHYKYDNDKRNKLKRHGTYEDVKALKRTLPKIGFRREDISVHEDLTKEAIMTEMYKLAKEDHSRNDCLMVFVLTHGNTDGALQAKDGTYNVKSLWEQFEADKCPSLAGKPKIFILQACRGQKLGPIVNVRNNDQSQVQVDGGSTDDENDIEYQIPVIADFLMAYSTEEDHVSFRYTATGSWFIQTLCDILSKQGMTQEYDLIRILTRVNKHIAVGNTEYEVLGNVRHSRKTDAIENSAATAVVTDNAVGDETAMMLEGASNKMKEDTARNVVSRPWYHGWSCLGKKEVSEDESKVKMGEHVQRRTRQMPAFNSRLTREVYFRPKTVTDDENAGCYPLPGSCLALTKLKGTTI